MYFLVIIAFSLLLANGLPPPEANLIPLDPLRDPGLNGAALRTLLAAAGTILAAGIVGAIGNRLTLRKTRDPEADGDDVLDAALDGQSRAGLMLLITVAAGLIGLMVLTPWVPLVRGIWRLDRLPLVGDLVLIAPFGLSILAGWVALYPSERYIRAAAMRQRVADGLAPRPIWGMLGYLVYRLRHQVLVVAAPMLPVLVLRYFLEGRRGTINAALGVSWGADALLGVSVSIILLFAPLIVRYVWVTQRLPQGELRERLERQCARIGLRYREILVWDSQGLIVNAAVMGFVAPVRYIMLSDGLIESMGPRQIEAVFGHEAGHVRHYHLQFFALFAALSMLVVGGLLEVVVRLLNLDAAATQGALQLAAMAGMLVVWAVGFGWVSRQFERQADIFGVRAITADIETCAARCPIHAADGLSRDAMREPVLCLSAAQLFGAMLLRIADLNGIPREAHSWRHGSIQNRCELVAKLAERPAEVARFDRRLLTIKWGMALATLGGTLVAAWLYRVDLLVRAVMRGMS